MSTLIMQFYSLAADMEKHFVGYRISIMYWFWIFQGMRVADHLVRGCLCFIPGNMMMSKSLFTSPKCMWGMVEGEWIVSNHSCLLPEPLSSSD